MNSKQIKERAKAVVKAGKNHGNLLLSEVICSVISAIVLVGIVCVPCISLGKNQIYLDAVNNKETDLKTLYSKFKKQFGSSFLLAASSAVMVLVALAVVFVIIVFLSAIFSIFKSQFLIKSVVVIGIILGIILSYFVGITISVACHVLLREPEIDGVEALKKGWAIASKNPGVFLKLFFSFFGWWLLTLFTFGLVLVYVIPYYGIANTLLLEQLYNGTSKEELDRAASESFKETAGAAASSIKATASAAAGVVSDAATNVANNISSKIEEKKNENAAMAESDVTYCPSCGAKNLKDSSFCEKCGTKLR